MNYTHQNNLRLFARNEGKIKSFASCTDVRAWSHDLKIRDRHLREWMKADMPVCIIAANTLTGILRTMTCKSRRRATPRCHPDCKSQVLLESICSSCQAIRECLEQNYTLHSYFVEEELETSHWPCERCLEALKSIKMFWKIIIDKIFNLNLSKHEEFVTKCEPTESAKTVAKTWQNEIMQQALVVKNITSSGNNISDMLKKENSNLHEEIPIKPNKDGDGEIKTYVIEPQDTNVKKKKSCKTVSKSTSTVIKAFIDAKCDTCLADVENEEIRELKKQINHLNNTSFHLSEEMETLKKENHSLKMDLGNIYKNCPWNAIYNNKDQDKFLDTQYTYSVPKPFEENNIEDPVHIDSEMIITMKNCRNQTYKHVSLLQVIHKTNKPALEHVPGCHCKHEDPMKILNKVQNTFGAMVKREMTIVTEKMRKPKKSDTDSSVFHHIHASRSAPSYSTVSSRLSSSEQEFVST